MIRIGVLTPHAAIGPEAEFSTMAPGRLITCVARVTSDAGADSATPPGLRLLASPQVLDGTVATFDHGAVDAMAYASTSSAYAIGIEAEEALVSRLSRRFGIPVAATCASAVLALRAFDVERLALVHPPWFDDELHALGAAYFQRQGFDVSSSSAALPQDPAKIDAAGIYEWAVRHISVEAEAVFFGGNGFRAAGAIAALEDAIRRPVLTSNQVLLWRLLALVGGTDEVSGYGRVFTCTPSRLTGSKPS